MKFGNIMEQMHEKYDYKFIELMSDTYVILVLSMLKKEIFDKELVNELETLLEKYLEKMKNTELKEVKK